MTKGSIDELVDEYMESAQTQDDPDLRLIEAAIFIEDCFGLKLGEDDFLESKIGPDALRSFVRERIGA